MDHEETESAEKEARKGANGIESKRENFREAPTGIALILHPVLNQLYIW